MLRRIVQIASIFVLNPWLGNFVRGDIYQGKLKQACVPVLNCWSCPAAAFSCPIGAIQNLLSDVRLDAILMHVFGLLIAVGAVLGRMTCGWVCPFGTLQDGLYAIPAGRWKLKLPAFMRYGKYLVLLVAVLGIPYFLRVPGTAGAGGSGERGFGPFFCSYICPAGTLEAALPIISAEASYRQMLGWQFVLKASILGLLIIAMVFVKRPFCRALCPLGAILALASKVSLVSMQVDEENCIRCYNCQRVCPTDVKIFENPSSAECIHCFRCVDVCPAAVISARFAGHIIKGKRLAAQEADA